MKKTIINLSKELFVLFVILSTLCSFTPETSAVPLCQGGERVAISTIAPTAFGVVAVKEDCKNQSPFQPFWDGSACKAEKLDLTIDFSNFLPNEIVHLSIFGYGNNYDLNDIINDAPFQPHLHLIAGFAVRLSLATDGSYSLPLKSNKLSPTDVSNTRADANKRQGNIFTIVKKKDFAGNDCYVTDLANGNPIGNTYIFIP